MKIVLLETGARHHKFAIDLFSKGLKKHGIQHNITNEITKCDLLVGWGSRTVANKSSFCQDFLMMEASYLEPRTDEKYWPLTISLGYNGLNGRADFLNKGKDSTRWNKLYNDGRLKEWKKEGDYILLTGQILSDASIKDLNFNYIDIAKQIRDVTETPIIFKPHPRGNSGTMNIKYAKVDNTNLIKLLEKAKAVVTINSNSGVDSIVNGVPVLALDKGSMCWDICMKNFEELNNISYPERQQWLNEISWCQWFYEEIENGDAWEHLKQKFS